MEVTLIAATDLTVFGLNEDRNVFAIDPVVEKWMDVDDSSTSADAVAEFAGRSCYQSFGKPNPKTSTNSAYLWNILAQGHESVLEHASATFYITGISRSLTHELIRHRHLSFSELSQRFVDVGEAETVVPPAMRDSWTEGLLDDAVDNAGFVYDRIAEELQNHGGLTRKQAREAARAVMPNATETRIVVTGNHRAWRDVLRKRWSIHADAEIRELAGELLTQLRKLAPNTYQDIPTEPYGS